MSIALKGEERAARHEAVVNGSAAVAHPGTRVIRVFLIDDQVMVREGVKEVLRAEPDIQVIGESGGQRGVLDRALALCPNVIVVGTPMSGGDGVEIIQTMRPRCPQTKVLVLAPPAGDERLRAAAEARAFGCVPKTISPGDLVDAIRATDVGRPLRQTFAAEHTRHADAAPPATGAVLTAAHGFRQLTPRETDVLSAVASGLRDRDIATRLVLSEATVKSHLRAIYRKVRARNRAQVAALVIKTGFLRPAARETVPPAGGADRVTRRVPETGVHVAS